MPEDKPRILFVCMENAGRSQMAEALAKLRVKGRAEIWSAGSKPGRDLHPEVKAVLHEKGISTTELTPKGLDQLPNFAWDFLVTMGCGDDCPLVHAVHRQDWDLPNPKDQAIEKVRALRDDIEHRVIALLKAAGL